MYYFYAPDLKYYNDDEVNKLKEKYKLDEIIYCYDKKQFKKEIKRFYKGIKTAVISPLELTYFDKKIISQNVVYLVSLPNEFGLLTSQDKEKGVTEEYILSNKLNVEVTKPKLTLDNYIGKNSLKEEVHSIKLKKIIGLSLKGFFLTGVPGTGKSHFVKCVAGELGRTLINLNLYSLIEKYNTLELLTMIFEFFKKNKGFYILWIDEIEKMLADVDNGKVRAVIGYLLTQIQEFGQYSDDSDMFIMTTSNNLSALKKAFPELFRNGRFDYLIALEPSAKNDAQDLIEYHCNTWIKRYKDDVKKIIYKIISEKNFKNDYLQNINENSLIYKIYSSYVNEETKYNSLLQEYSNFSLKDFLIEIDKNINSNLFHPLKIFFNSIIEEYPLNIDIEELAHIINIAYTDDKLPTKNFPLVPAEVEYLASYLYVTYLFKDVDCYSENTLKDILLKKISPIQIVMKDSIQDIQAVTSEFLKV